MTTDFARINSPRAILYYGGSFNPPHIAHVMMVSMLRAYFPQACIWVSPAYRHAFDKSLMDYEVRCEMLRACLDGIPNVEISDIERTVCLEDAQNRGYTVDVVRKILSLHPGAEIHIVVGSDILETLPKWHEYGELCKMAEFLVFPRQGYDNRRALPVPMLPEVSSSQIRAMLENSNDLNEIRGLVPAAVLDRMNLA